ncbi:MAG TPA: hypothetical protein VES88_17360 [Gemmatimonadaceae bacterium]|nr:hypothetical protein [Gemmatimonadaceae bacterium]
MTDAPTCTGIYSDEWLAQLSKRAFYVSYRGRGGVKGVTLRFGDEPALPLRLPTRAEKSVSAVILEDDDFLKVLASARLRLQVVTVLDNVLTDDIALTGLRAAHDFIATNAACQ